MNAPLAHPEIPVKVTAWVDEGVAPLVAALNGFERIVTLDSCQGDETRGPYVLFAYRGDAQEAASFAADLGGKLAAVAPEFLLQAEWRPGGEGEPLLALTCPPNHVGQLAEALSACRMRLSACGMPGREPGS